MDQGFRIAAEEEDLALRACGSLKGILQVFKKNEASIISPNIYLNAKFNMTNNAKPQVCLVPMSQAKPAPTWALAALHPDRF